MTGRAIPHRLFRRPTSRRAAFTAFAGAAFAVAAILLVVAISSSSAIHAQTARTVLLIHGFGSTPSAMDRLQARLQDEGIPSIEVDLPGDDPVANAAAIRDVISSRGLTSVDIVAHSMGGLAARWYLKELGGAAGTPPTVVNSISLATPQYGNEAGCLLRPTAGGEMCPTSAFLAQLNQGDDTPGETAYTSISSTGDHLVRAAAARLDGGACLAQVDGVDHFGMRTDARVFALVLSALRGTCPGTLQ